MNYEEKDSFLPIFGIAEVDQFIEQGGTRVNHPAPEHLTGAVSYTHLTLPTNREV